MTIYKNTITHMHTDIEKGIREGITDTQVCVGELVMISHKSLISITPENNLLPILQSKRTDTINHEMDEETEPKGTS